MRLKFLVFLSILLFSFNVIAVPCSTDDDCAYLGASDGIAFDVDGFTEVPEEFGGGFSPGIPGSVQRGGPFVCLYGVCVAPNDNSFTNEYESDWCNGYERVREHYVNEEGVLDYKDVNCANWCSKMYKVNGQCVEDTIGYYTCMATPGGKECDYCKCEGIVMGTPSVKVLSPNETLKVLQNESGTWSELRYVSYDNRHLNYVDFLLATPLDGVHCDDWDTQMLLFNPAIDLHTYDCRFEEPFDCRMNEIFFNYDLNNRNPEICPIEQMDNECAIMAHTQDIDGLYFATNWTIFTITTCGNDICEGYLGENPDTCYLDCEYSYREQLGKIFNMVKTKVKIWR